MPFHIGSKFGDFKKDRNTEELIKFDRLRTIFELLIKHPQEITIKILMAENSLNPGSFYRNSMRMKYKNGEKIKGEIIEYYWWPREPKAGQIFNDVSRTIEATGGLLYFKDNEEGSINIEDINKIYLNNGNSIENTDLFPWHLANHGGVFKWDLNNKEYVSFIKNIILE